MEALPRGMLRLGRYAMSAAIQKYGSRIIW